MRVNAKRCDGWRTLRLSGLLWGLWLLAAAGVQADALHPLSLQLKWRHHFQFAGYYLALEKGYYREAGLDVRLLPGQPAGEMLDLVLQGQADFGIAGSELAVARGQGLPVVSLAVIFQHSPAVLFARRDAGIDSVHDLPGKRVVLQYNESEPFAYLLREGVPRASLMRVAPPADQVQALLSGVVDVISGYSTDEAYALRQAGLDFIELTPRAAGLDFYGDTLFTREALVEQQPERVEAFRRASLRGWSDALADVAGTAAFIQARYAPDLSLEKLRFEGEQMRRLIFPELIELGYQHPGRWQAIGETYKSLGMLPADADIEGLIYRSPQPLGRGLLNWVSLSTLAGLLLVGWVAQRFYRLSRSLRLSNGALTERLAENQRLQVQLREAAERDPLTGLHNRRYVHASLPHELARARREGRALGLVLIDIDHFKQVNDSHGHAAGDQVLRALAQWLQGQARAGDTLSRWGGEEFLLVLPNIDAQTLSERVDQLRQGFNRLRPLAEAAQQAFSFSAGLALYPIDGGDGETLTQAADRALYAAKHAGRNRVMAAAELPPQ